MSDLMQLAIKYGATPAATLAAAYALFRWLGSKWLEGKFAERLEDFKHAKNREIEELRFRINAMFDRTVKLHAQEFEVLPLIWDKLSEAFGHARNFTSRIQSYAQVNNMNPPQFEEFIVTTKLLEWQKNELRELSGSVKFDRYKEYQFWSDYGLATNAHTEFHNYFIAKGIFILPELKEKVRDLSNMIYDALKERALDMETPQLGEGRFKDGDKFQKDGLALYQEIERDVQARLWDRDPGGYLVTADSSNG